MTRTRTAVALTAVILLGLAACSTEDDPKDEPVPEYTAEVEAGGEPAEPLAPGDTYTWDADGITATVDKVEEFTQLGEYDTPIEPGQIPIRVYVTLTNEGAEPVDVIDFDATVEGATTGGVAQVASFEEGANEFGGRVAPGHSAQFTVDRTFGEEYGAEVIVTVERWDDPTLPRPEWATTIQ